MSSIRRAWYSGKDKINRELLLFGLFLILACLRFGSRLAEEQMDAKLDEISRNIGGSVLAIGAEEQEVNHALWRLAIDEKTAGELETLPGVKRVEYMNTGKCGGLGIKPDLAFYTEEELVTEEKEILDGFHVYGLNDFAEGDKRSGNYATISQSVAEKNGLHIGDSFKVRGVSGVEEELIVSGIHSLEMENGVITPRWIAPENRIFTSPEVVCRLNGKTAYAQATLKLTSAEEADKVAAAVEKKNLKAQKNIVKYLQEKSQVTGLERMIRATRVAVEGIGIVILCLLVIYFVLERLREIRILISMGITKRSIFLQQFLEIAFPLCLANVIVVLTECVVVRGKDMDKILEMRDVTYYYEKKKKKNIILEHADISFEKGKMYALLGKSGIGKSTTLALLSALSTVKGGTILYDGKQIQEIGYGAYRRNYIGMVFQNYNLLEYYSACQNVMETMAVTRKNKHEMKEKAYEILEKMGIDREMADRNVRELSGGQQQRVAIARAVAADAEMILADEATGNLDEETALEVIELLQKLAHEEGKCVIAVTHTRMLADKADIVLKMKDKKFAVIE